MSKAESDVYVESQGRRYRLMTLKDFRSFRDLALSDDAQWTTQYSDKTLTVQSKPPSDGSTSLNIIRARRVMERVPPRVLYDQLQDAQYRETWDRNMIEGYNIVQLDAHNDIGYYAVKFLWPLANRDFCNQRSWMEFTNGEYIIMNHSEPHNSCPEKKGFVRARSICTGFFMQPYNNGKGTLLTYVTHTDPCGSIPHRIINFAMTKGAPMILNNCEKCSEDYPEYVKKTYPPSYNFPWRTPPVDWDAAVAAKEDTGVPAPPEGLLREASQRGLEVVGSTSSLKEDKMAVDAARADGISNPGMTTVVPSVTVTAGTVGITAYDPMVSLAPVAPLQPSELLCIQQFRTAMQDAMNTVDRSFLREGRAPTTREYMLRLKYFIEGIRQTCPG